MQGCSEFCRSNADLSDAEVHRRTGAYPVRPRVRDLIGAIDRRNLLSNDVLHTTGGFHAVKPLENLS